LSTSATSRIERNFQPARQQSCVVLPKGYVDDPEVRNPSRGDFAGTKIIANRRMLARLTRRLRIGKYSASFPLGRK
jgi:hypothetical protein